MLTVQHSGKFGVIRTVFSVSRNGIPYLFSFSRTILSNSSNNIFSRATQDLVFPRHTTLYGKTASFLEPLLASSCWARWWGTSKASKLSKYAVKYGIAVVTDSLTNNALSCCVEVVERSSHSMVWYLGVCKCQHTSQPLIIWWKSGTIFGLVKHRRMQISQVTKSIHHNGMEIWMHIYGDCMCVHFNRSHRLHGSWSSKSAHVMRPSFLVKPMTVNSNRLWLLHHALWDYECRPRQALCWNKSRVFVCGLCDHHYCFNWQSANSVDEVQRAKWRCMRDV